jgi:hypothetical protein
MFDHVKRMKDWTTSGIHVYDPHHHSVMTTAIYNMQLEKADAQERVWLSLLAVMEKHGMSNVNFKGFMCDSAQANSKAVRVIFGSKESTVPMENRERTCLLHWKMALERHTKQLFCFGLQVEHIWLCQEYSKEPKYCWCKRSHNFNKGMVFYLGLSLRLLLRS